MFSTERIKIRFIRFMRNMVFHTIFWELTFLLYIFLVSENYLLQVYDNINTEIGFGNFIFFNALTIAFLFSFVDYLFTDRVMRFFPSALTRFFRTLLYFLIAFSIVWLAQTHTFHTINIGDIRGILLYISEGNIHLLRFLVYFLIMCYLNGFISEAIKKVGAGNLQGWISGALNKPHEQERIFMFIDLKSSTTIAESLGHRKFSHLIQDIFNDMAIVDNYGGEIYQYLGDGAIISWSVKKGLKNNNFIKAYFAVANLVYKRRRYYNRRYGLEPKFKAGVHIGKVMVLQVGQIRRDISYNGDTMNTSARIESKCNELKQQLLISGQLFNRLNSEDGYRFTNVGNITLRGKKKAVELYGIKQKITKKRKK